MVQRVLVASAVIVLAAAGQPAAAADVGRMPAKAPPIAAPIPVPNWTGLYVGGNAGYSWGRTDLDYSLAGVPTFRTNLDPKNEPHSSDFRVRRI